MYSRSIDMIELDFGLGFVRSFYGIWKSLERNFFVKNMTQMNSILRYIVIFFNPSPVL